MEDKVYFQQLKQANKLGNSLLSGFVEDTMAENKRNIKITSILKTLRELIESFRNEVYKMEFTRIGLVSNILDLKANSIYTDQIELTEKNLDKIDNILRSHVQHNQSKVISKEELKALIEHASSFESIAHELSKVPESHEFLHEQLEFVKAIQSNLDQIMNNMGTSSSELKNLQQTLIAESSDTIWFSI